MTPVEGRPVLQDEEARRRIRHSLDESLMVEASAGAGKTTELVHRMVQVLATGRGEIENIVAVTFTHKAAGELKIRLRQKLDEERTAARKGDDAETAMRLESAIEHLEEASIGTIHGFCAQILRSRPVEARIDPAFEELTEPEANRIYERAFQGWFERQLDRNSPGLRRALARLAWREDWEDGPALEQLKKSARNLVEWRDFTAQWQPQPFDRESVIATLLEGARKLRQMSCACTRSGDSLLWSLRPLRDTLGWIERGRVTDTDTLEAVLLKLGRDLKRNFKKGKGFFSNEVTREAMVASVESFQGAMEEFRISSGVTLACELQQEMRPLVAEYQDLKARTGKLDFMDLLLLARDLVRGNEDVRRYLQSRFSHIFVDEFQDTDPLQAEILLLLSSAEARETDWLNVTPAAGKLFLVGDPKQSIYKFRRADVSLYARIADNLRQRGVGRVMLTRSYRSVGAIQKFVNAAFAPEMTGDAEAAQASYSPLAEDGPEVEGQPAIVALPAPRPYGQTGITKKAIDECLPTTIAAYIDWLIHKCEPRWQVRDSGAWKPLEARHICILFRRFINFQTDLTREYVRALEARNIPHLLVGSKSFHDREEVETVRTALTAVEWPEDELSVYATLRGSLFAVSDNVLLRFRHEHLKLHPFRKYPAELQRDFEPVTHALGVLADLHRQRNRRPLADTVRALLDEARAHAGFAMRPGGQQVLANVYRICDLARQYELTGGFSFRGFVEELNAQAEKTEAPEAPVLEEAADGVRLMTVHNAKGLEFPVVILADMTANLCSREPDRHIDAEKSLCATRLLRSAPLELLHHEPLEMRREQAEGVRVCYVAATRARDLLVVTACGDEAREGWLAPLNKALYPPRQAWRSAAGCEWFRGDCTVLDRLGPPFDPDPSVKPGFHHPEAGEHRVLWWDPGALDLNVPENFGLRHINVLKAEGASEESLRDYRAWQTRHAERIVAGAAASLSVVRVTDLEDEPPPGAVAIAKTGRAEARSHGRRYGTLVHAILRDAAWNATRQEIERLAAMYRAVGAATPEEERDAVEAAAAALVDPLLRRAAASSRCHREIPVTLPLSGGRVLEGVIDLAFLENGKWRVVDFKTDGDVEANREAYERQLRWYMHALATLTGVAAEGVLLQV
jgi:ATP-dependent exoDNAse (exonuclease V) beta subunit